MMVKGKGNSKHSEQNNSSRQETGRRCAGRQEVTWVSIEVMWTRSRYSLKIFDYVQALLRTNAWSLEHLYVLTVPL